MRSSRRRSFAPWRTAACWVGSATGDMVGRCEGLKGARGAGGWFAVEKTWCRLYSLESGESREERVLSWAAALTRTECPQPLLIDTLR